MILIPSTPGATVVYEDNLIVEAEMELPGGVVLSWAAGVGSWTDEEGQPDV